MNFLDSIDKGLLINGDIIPWKMSFENLKKIENSNFSTLSKSSEEIVFKDILFIDGVIFNISITRHKHIILGSNKVLKSAEAFITEEQFKLLQNTIEKQLLQPSNYKKINSSEFRYKWTINDVKIILIQKERFGNYWKVIFQHKSSLSGFLIY